MVVLILIISVFLQISAAIFSLSFVKDAKGRIPWLLIIVVLCLMLARSLTELFSVIFSYTELVTPTLFDASIETLITALFFYGLWVVKPIFLKIKHAEKFETSFSKIIENSFNEVYIFSYNDLTFLKVNSSVIENTQYTDEELMLLRPVDLEKNSDEEKFKENLASLKNGISRIRFETSYQRKNGSAYPVEVVLQNIIFKGNAAFIAIVKDISEKENAAKVLRDSERYFRSLIEHSQDITTVLDWDGNIIYQSPSVTRALGYEPQELIDKSGFTILHPGDQQLIDENMEHARQEGSSKSVIYRLRHKNGGWRTIEGSAWVGEKPDGSKMFVINQRDITDREEALSEKARTQSLLNHVQRIDTVGSLSGGIAHDFNNLLTPIMGYASLLSEQLSIYPDIHNDILQIEVATKRAQTLVQQLLAFSRHVEPKFEEVILEDILKEAMGLVRVAAPSSIEIHEEFKAKDTRVLADSTQLHQIVMNLCTNSIDAMGGEEGSLQISLMKTDFCPATQGENLPPRSGSFICLSVSDSGEGISDSVLKRIFEPFFTTKKAGKGTGLGLAIVQAIVIENGGVINISSELKVGTTFKVYFPILDLNVNPKNEEALLRVTGVESILVVDDDAVVSEVTTRMLRKYGYQVHLINDPEAALEEVKKNDIYDLVITDLSMPKLTGLELAEALHKFRADLPIILMSGYSAKIRKADISAAGISASIDKPFTDKVLASKVRSALDQKKMIKLGEEDS